MKYFYVVLCRTGTFLSKIISKATGDNFTHASISFDDKLLNNNYTSKETE